MAKGFSKSGFGETDRFFSKITSIQSRGKKSLKATIRANAEVTSFADLDALKAKLPSIVNKATKKTLTLVANELKNALNEAMEARVWQWDYGDGDIIDTGALQKSLRIVTTSDGDIQVFYNQEYAAIVHYGGYIHPYGNPRVQIYMPQRPWISSVLEGGGPIPRFDFEGVFERIFIPELQKLASSAGLA